MERELERVLGLGLWAWVGQDDGPEPRTGELGLKQGIVPAGYIPLVAVKQEKITTDHIKRQMEALAQSTGVRRYLVRFKVEAVEEVIEPSSGLSGRETVRQERQNH